MWEVNRTIEQTVVDEMWFRDAYYDGSYYQPADPDECSKRQESMRSKIETGRAGDITLDELQDWVELNWLTQHGTYETGLRLTEKFLEEGSRESIGALAHLAPRSEDQEAYGDTTDGAEELGDTVLTLVANASNGGISMQVAVAEKLGITGPVTLSRLHEVIQNSPLWVPYWLDIDPEEVGTVFSDRDELDPEITLALSAIQLRRLTHQRFQHGEPVVSPPHPDIQRGFADVHADALLLLCYDIQQWARTDLADVVSTNFVKIERRLQDNTIDKSLGNRPQ